jgi:hypothetical protein
VIAEVRALAQQLLMAIDDLIAEMKALRQELAARKTTTGGERND